jgi:hypothetical protein
MIGMPTQDLNLFTSGVLTAGYWIAALFFLRFWQRCRDRLFATFAAAFVLLGIQRIALATVSGVVGMHDALLWPYLIRLAAFGLILWAIIDKNRR